MMIATAILNPEYINTSGYILLLFNLVTISTCIATSVFWASLCIYENSRPKMYSFMILMFGASLCAIVANSFALIRMFDSFLVVKMHINSAIIKNTVIDRLGMMVTFAVLLFAAIKFKNVTCEIEP